ncbi:MAG: hypothetical protein JST44_18745, partial [Cyanobacteria bacterium SZAS LIN-5]|nr:hypothetical protein [Cyanobacteria bacterium SZAS LIN-5]
MSIRKLLGIQLISVVTAAAPLISTVAHAKVVSTSTAGSSPSHPKVVSTSTAGSPTSHAKELSQKPSGSAVAATARAADGASGYNVPPKNILDVMLAPAPPMPKVSPTYDSVLLVSWQDYPSIARVATPFLKLAGVRVEPKNHSKHDSPGGYGITPCASNFDVVRTADGAMVHVTLPKAGCPGNPFWAADGKQFAFVNAAADSVELWVADAKTGAAHQIPGAKMNPMLDNELQWMPDQKTLLVKLVPDELGAPPPQPVTPIGPSIQESKGEKGQSSTYETRDTLRNKHDEDLFDYYSATQLALVDTATGKITKIGKPGSYETVDA